MNILKLNQQEQFIAATVIGVIILIVYGVFRFFPENRIITDYQDKAAVISQRLLKERIPEEPYEDIDALKKELKNTERELLLLKEQAVTIKESQAPADSHVLKVRISQLARENDVYIKVNERKQVQSVSLVSAKARKNRKAVVAKKPVLDLILPKTESWVRQMSPGTLFHRPMQRIVLEGNYMSIYKFIYGLNTLPYQVTVLNIRIEKNSNESPAGYPQLLDAEMILSL